MAENRRVLALGGHGKPAMECRPSDATIYDFGMGPGKLIAWRDKRLTVVLAH